MCEIGKKTIRRRFTGYKAVLKINGRYYSPSTGLEYEEGMTLPHLNNPQENACPSWRNPLTKGSYFYREQMQGKTGVFMRKKDCNEKLVDASNYILLKMTIGGSIYRGDFDGYKLRIGTKIIKFKEVKIK